VKLFSVTDVFPESQNFLELSEFVNGLHLLTFIEGQDDMFTLKSLGGNVTTIPSVQIAKDIFTSFASRKRCHILSTKNLTMASVESTQLCNI
jgi:hypothetical protein